MRYGMCLVVGGFVLLLSHCSDSDESNPPVDAGIDSTVDDVSIPDPPEQVTGLAAVRTEGDTPSWEVSWAPLENATEYQVQEAPRPDFSDATIQTLTDPPLQVQKEPSTHNVFYYRVRALSSDQVGAWSESLRVIGGYRAAFNEGSDDWRIRRTTYIEKVNAWREQDSGKNWLVLQVADRWDWGIVSPLMPAPAVPYNIEYRAQVAEDTWLASHGLAFAGDWNGQLCPDPSADVYSDAGRYQQTRCFNHFYVVNVIYNNYLDLLFERVDELNWCETCGGSPMKRLGDSDVVDNVVQTGTNDGQALGWNTWRIEVRSDGIDVFVNDQLKFHYDDVRWIQQRYFGFFASADEYNNSTTRFDYIEVVPVYEAPAD